VGFLKTIHQLKEEKMKIYQQIPAITISLLFGIAMIVNASWLPADDTGTEITLEQLPYDLTTEAGILMAIKDEAFMNSIFGTGSEVQNPALPGTPDAVRIGDFNNDKEIDIKDALRVAQYWEGKDLPSCIPEVADVNRDGVINLTDAVLIARYWCDLIPAFPVVNVDVLLSQMTLREKIGQMIQVEQTAIFDDEFRTLTSDPQKTWIPETGICPDDVTTYAIGSFLTGGDSFPYTAGNVQSATPKDWADMYDTLQEKALANRLMIPLIYGADAIHGFGNLQGATIFPHNIGLGATRDADLVQRIGRITAIESTAAGVDWAFAPCVSVPQDDRWGRTYEGFSEDQCVVSQLGVAYIKGLQGAQLDEENSILATVKHFIGDGGTAWGSGIMAKRDSDQQIIGGFLLDRGSTSCSETELRNLHLAPYIAAINQPPVQVGAVMVSFSSWNMEKCHESKYLITDVLKNELGFKGFVTSDWNGFAQINAPSYSDPAELDTTINDLLPSELKACINAGVDMLMAESIWSNPWKFKEVMQMIEDLVVNGEIPMERIDDAARRILTVKKNLGLFETPFTNRNYQQQVGSPDHRAVAREAVRKSMVLLRNNYNILPVRKGIGHIHVTGPKANDMQSQCGGWTLTWQGAGNLLTGGTTILEGIRKAVAGTNSIVTYSEDGTVPSGANVVFVVVGENSYAEYAGDRGDDINPLCLCEEDIAVINRAKSSNVPVIGILLCGSPIIITDQLEKFDALIAAWLPGSEGQGVADVLLGDYRPTGKLSFTWPRSCDQIPINDPCGSQNPLFPFGFGLTYP
jgi:beta-glucosidase